MEHRFSAGPMEWRTMMDEDGLHIYAGPRPQIIRWADIVGAGMAPIRPGALPADLPHNLLPGLHHAAAAVHSMPLCLQVMIAYQPAGRGGRKLKTLAISSDDIDQVAFFSEIRARLGSLWEGDEVDYLELRRRLGFGNWWIAPAVLLMWLLIFVVLITFWDLRMRYALLITLMGLAIGLFVNLVKRWARI
jgi:hypothetical protein